MLNLHRPQLVLGLLVLQFALAGLAPMLCPHPNQTNMDAVFRPWGARQRAFRDWLGTDSLGRSNLARLLEGARTSLGLAAVAGLSAGMLGCCGAALLSLLPMFCQVGLRSVLMLDFSLPYLLILLVGRALIGTGSIALLGLFSFALTSTAVFILDGALKQILQHPSFDMFSDLGVPRRVVWMRHVLPQLLWRLPELLCLLMSASIFAEAGLTYLGVGIIPPRASLGVILADGLECWEIAPAVVWPALILFMSCLLFWRWCISALRQTREMAFYAQPIR